MGLVSKEYLAASAPRLVPQGGVFRREGLPFGFVRLEQPLLGALEGKPQAMQVIQATGTVQADAEAFRDEPVDHFPGPVGQFDAGHGRLFLHRFLQLRLLRLAEGGGEPPDCSKIKAAGPPSPKSAAHRPMV